ncbi:DUF2281 domain-containing protein [Spirochaeta africana]|uniref:DUF2281 domain-containing protein n=1 Tax=Spirochaeta africana (strain ATCC 700263 / DSM 8902 / Z-7692) TaxID=889378 RepID=H9UHF6_SPIAZ|nr:DUF2281 domain-containing protein [Spirochaeta africana]AFG36949.1 Protein of unknown function (DUF2281) [Spirochaeta africana DSM 8902]
MADIQELVRKLPAEAQHELLDFAEFLLHKYTSTEGKADGDFWNGVSEASLAHVWDNTEDDIYGELL